MDIERLRKLPPNRLVCGSTCMASKFDHKPCKCYPVRQENIDALTEAGYVILPKSVASALTEVVKRARAVAFSNAFGAAYKDRIASLRSALEALDEREAG